MATENTADKGQEATERGDGLTTQGLIDKMISTRHDQYIKHVMQFGMSRRKAEEQADIMRSGMRQAIADLKGMGVIVVLKND